MGASVTATQILFFWKISLVFFQRIHCSSSSTLFFSLQKSPNLKLIVLSITISFIFQQKKSLKQSTDIGLARLTNPCFLRFSSKSWRQQVSALSGSLPLFWPSSLHSYTHYQGCLLTLYSPNSGFSSYPQSHKLPRTLLLISLFLFYMFSLG